MIRKTIVLLFLLLAMGCILLWVRSYDIEFWERSLKAYHPASHWTIRLIPVQGRAEIEIEYESPAYVRDSAACSFARGWLFDLKPWYFFDFSMFINRKQPLYYASCTAIFPFWAAILVFLLYPALFLFRGPLLRRRRMKRGLCLHCGYDMRGNSEPRCPECGAESGET